MPANRPLAVALALLGSAALLPPVEGQVPNYQRRQLTPSGETGSDVRLGGSVDPRGEWVAFVGDVEIANAEAVYAMRRNGSALLRLSGYGAPGSVKRIQLSGDGRHVVYSGDLETNGLDELWSVPLPGTPGAAVKLNLPVTGDGVVTFEVAGDRAIYLVGDAADRHFWTVPVTGPAGASLSLDPPLTGDEIAYGLELTPDRTKAAVFYVDPTAQTSRIFAVPVAGPSASAVLLADAHPGGCYSLPSRVVPDGSRLLYVGMCPTASGNVVNQLWSVPMAGPAAAAVSLAGSFADGGALSELAVSPDSSRVVFSADKLVDEVREIFSVPVAGPAAALVRLNPTLVANGDVGSGIRISPDSTRVAFRADLQSDERVNVFAVPIDGPSTSTHPLYLGPIATPGDALDFEFSADSAWIYFRGDFSVDERLDLYRSPGDGVTPHARITNQGVPPAAARSVGFPWRVHPSGDRFVYAYDESAPFDRRGLGEQRFPSPWASDLRLNVTPVAGGQVSSFQFWPDGGGVLYAADELVDGKLELFTVDTRLFGDGFEEGTVAAWADHP